MEIETFLKVVCCNMLNPDGIADTALNIAQQQFFCHWDFVRMTIVESLIENEIV